MVILLLPQLTLPAKTADAAVVADVEDMTSNELAEAWGFSTEQTEDSLEREELGTNPWKGHTDTVNTFGEVPLEIAVVGGKASPDNNYHSQDNNDLDDIYYYDNITRNSGSSYLTMGTTGSYTGVDGITSEGEEDVRPSATVAADVNGDGFDEIVRYYIDISDGENDGDIQSFNDGDPDYVADFYVEVIDSQTGKRLNDKYSGQVLTVDKSDSDSENFFIPDSVYYWSSYMQITAGDYNNDGKADIAVMVPGSNADTDGKLVILDLEGSRLVQTYTQDKTFYSAYNKDDSAKTKFSAYDLTSGDCDNDGTDEVIYTNTYDVITQDDDSYINVLDYTASGYTKPVSQEIRVGQGHDNMGNAGVTVGDIDNDGLAEIIVGGFMVNDDKKSATYSYTAKDGSSTKSIPYYHEMAMSYMEYDNVAAGYSNFTAFSVFRDDEGTAQTCVGGNDTSYQTYSNRTLGSSRRYKNSDNWTIPIQAVSLTGYVNDKTNDQVFFGNYMYYYDSSTGLFKVYDSDGEVDVDSDAVVYNDIQAPTTSITTMVAGSFLSDDTSYVAVEGQQQLMVGYVRKKNNGDRSFEMALLYQNSGDTMAPKRGVKYIATADDDDFNDMKFYPTVCLLNMDSDTKYVQYVGHDFTFTEPEVLDVIASVPYFRDIMDAYPAGVWGDPGTTSLKYTSGGSETDTASTEVSLGWYFNFHQDISVLGIRLFSVELETNASVNTNYEYSKTVETESSIEYSTSEGQDSVVMVSSPLDVYQYRYYEATQKYLAAYPGAKKDDPDTWGLMEVSLPGKPATLVYSVDRYNKLAQKYGLEHIGSNFWTHTLGEPGSYPTSTDDFLNASNVIDSKDPASVVAGGGGETSELTITKKEENAYAVSFTLGAKFGVGVGGLVTGTTVENTTGYGGTTTSYEGTTITAALNGFPEQEKYPNVDLDTEDYYLSAKLHSYTTTFNDNDIMVLEFTVEDYRGLPKRVENFRSTGSTEDAINLAWEVPSVISAKLKPSKYILERYDPYYKEWETISSALPAAAGTNTYTDTDVYAGEDYQYRLISADSMGTTTNKVSLTASTRDPGQDPPEITLQPADVTAGIGENAEFSITAVTPKGQTATRIYYQWYMREDSSAEWSEVDGETAKKLTLTAVTEDMDGYQYYCEATRLATDGAHCTSQSNYATLSVLDHTPLKYKVSFSSDSNGTLTAQRVYSNGSATVTTGDSLPEGSSVTFTAVPASGYAVSKWTINGKTVSGNTATSLTVEDLSAATTVSVSFSLGLYTFRYNEIIDSGDTSHGTVTAKCNGNILPPAEDTTLPGNSKITIHATPDPGYMVYYLSDNKTHGGYYINDLTIDSLSYDTKVSVKFIKATNFNVTVNSYIVDNGVAYVDDSGYSVYVNGTEVDPGAQMPMNANVEITAKAPKSSIVDSWTIYHVDSKGKTIGTPITLGSQSSYTFNQLSSSYKVTINYRVVTTKTLNYSIKGGSGTLSAQVVGNTASSGKVSSGGKVQMYQDVALTVSPAADEELSGWLVNGVLESSSATTKVVNMNKNTVVQAVVETKPTAKNPAYAITMLADSTISLAGNSVADDADGDTLTFTAIEQDVDAPDVAKVKLGSGADSGKLLVTGISGGTTGVGTTNVVVWVSDDSGNSILVTVPITVSDNSQTVPTLTGVMNTAFGVNDGKIMGLDSTGTYSYKIVGSGDDYRIQKGRTAITGLAPGTYEVYCPARTGYTESERVYVTVESNDFAGGAGTTGNPYRITTASMLDKVRNHMDKCFILMNDIDLTEYLSITGEGYNSGQGFIPIGGEIRGTAYFFGTFDGNGRTITGLAINQPEVTTSAEKTKQNYVGLFANIYTTGVVRNLSVDVTISAYGNYVGAIAGQSWGTISRCYATGQITGYKNSYVGGLVGTCLGKIVNCYSTVDISGYTGFAGLVGYLGIYNKGLYSQQKGTITTSYSISTFTFTMGKTGLTAGGLVAEMDADAIINNSWAYYTYTNSYYPINQYTVNSKNTVYSPDTLKSKSFLENSTYDKWNFDSVWSIDDGKGYPKLRTPIYVTGIALDKTDMDLSVGETGQLTAVITPADAASRSLYWVSSDLKVAEVDQEDGTVTAVGAGTAEITVSACDGSGKTDKCTVTVTDPESRSISLSQTEDYTFTDQTTGYEVLIPLRVTITNTGNQATGDLTVTLSGDNADAFELSTGTISGIAFGGTYDFDLNPITGLSAGTYTATVTVSGDNVTSQAFHVSFTVSDTATYGISLSQTEDYTFDGRSEGYSALTPLSVTITSTGNRATGDLTVMVTGTNADSFTLSTASISNISSGGTDSFTVTPNTGLTAGTYTAAITVSGSSITVQAFNVSFTVSKTSVEDNSDASINPNRVTYDLAAPEDVVTTIDWHSASTVTDVVFDTISLTTLDAYVVSGSALTIKGSYINTLEATAGDTLTFTISFDTGKAQTFTVSIIDSDTTEPVELTGTAAISNTSPKVGDTLTGSLVGGNNTGSLTYLWKAGGTPVGTGISYIAAAADLGKTITLEITSSVETGTVTSEATAAVGEQSDPEAVLQSINITIPATKLTYNIGDSLDISGMVVTGTYSDNSTKVETVTGSSITGFDSSAPAASQVLTVTVDGKTTNYTVSINAAPAATLQSIAITTPATKLIYTVGDSLDISGMVVTGTYSDSSTKVETVTGSSITGFDSSTPAVNQVLTVTVGGKTATYTITINAAPAATLQSIAITTPATKLIYTVGDSLDISGMVVTGTYSDSSTKVETVTGSSITGFDSSAPAVNQVLTVTVGGKTATYTVTITAATYQVTINGSYASASGAGSYTSGDIVTINAGSRSNYSFDSWTSADGITFANSGSATTTFTMLAKDVTLTASWSHNSSTGGNSSGGSSSGSNSSGGSSSDSSYSDTQAEIKVGGTPTTVDGNIGYSATITADQVANNTADNAVVTIGETTVSLPASVLTAALGDGTSLTLTQSTPSASARAAAQAAAEMTNGIALAVININLNRTAALGTEEIHDLSGEVTVTINLTEEQAAAIAAGKQAYIYYYDPETGMLTNMEAVFDVTAKTATFSTTHFSIYVLTASGLTKPSVSGVTDQGIYGDDRTITFEDATAALDGETIGSGDTVSSEGNHILVLTDQYGITATIEFVIDKSAPVIKVANTKKESVKNKGFSNSNVTVTISDLSEVTKTVTRNGKAYAWPSKNTFTKEGKYIVTVKDELGNSIKKVFTVDKTAPVITVKTSKKGKNVSIQETNLSSRTVTLNGKKIAWPKDNKFTEAGSYVITVTDLAKHKTKYQFKI